ncbi:hypothetical protein HYH03_003050 [Edaphochlamys debaryana]|uniref:Uncharacterized protein n=1 Tax=Edaphochlamys debaryana TaxID=47281 RepID=A0A835YA29_9CHLO|nr:hypothetical protein HYH03_003050 [Edaphochlamys debaryana]|eukprot:KAG2498858.1 hypothetical protein HYH03_003050 [Edaphochlamys debaryana]
MRKECPLCKNNPNKKCREEDNFDEAYADGQILKSKCEADVFLEIINLRTGQPEALPSVEIAVSVVDGESYSETAPGNYGHVKELLKNDDDSILLGAYQAGSKTEADGRLYLRMNEGQVKLPDVCVTDKNDTFHLNNETFGTFRLMARAVRREGYHLTPVENVRPTVSGRFIVKTQRALNDYRKSEYPHYKDELTKLKHIGSITAQRLREIQQHLDCPYSTIETVEQLKQLMQYADQNRQVENKMLELLNMKGKHKHKWDYLREVLAERVVYDDMLHRLWYTDDSCGQGVIFSCKQGQVNMERPIGLVQRAPNGRLVVTSSPTGGDAETLKQWRLAAEQSWHTPGHRGWTAVQEQLEMVNAGSGGSSLLIGGGASMSMQAGTPSMSIADGLDDQMVARRGSVGMGPSGMMLNDSARSRRSSAVSYPTPDSPGLGPPGMYGMQQGGMQGDMQGMQGGQAPFQFTGGRSMAAHTLISSGLAAAAGDLGPDVYRTASAPNMAAANIAASPPLYSHNSIDSTGGGSNLVGQTSGPQSGPIGGQGGDGGLGPPPMRPARYRRLSADATAVRQMAMMQAAGMQQPADLSVDLTGKRSRNSAPQQPLFDELQMQMQMQQQAQMQQAGNGGAEGPNRHALYHFESRGRHTPRSRLSQEVSDSAAASALGGVLDTSDIESYLAQNFSFINNEPTLSGGAMPEQGGGVMGGGMMGGSMGGNTLGIAAMPSAGLSGPLMNMSLQPSEQQLTGQMQHSLILGDQGGRMGGPGPGGLMGMDPHQHAQHQQMGQHGGVGMSAGAVAGGSNAGGMAPQPGRALVHQDSGGAMWPNQANRQLKHCESDSFKRFLAVGLPFAPMEPMPEDLLEGMRRDSGLMGE